MKFSVPAVVSLQSRTSGLRLSARADDVECMSAKQRLRDLEQENARLKRMYANLSLEHEPMKRCSQKNGDAAPPDGPPRQFA
jgi:hypothetical protein